MAGLKLLAASGGSVTLIPTDTTGNYTVSLPITGNATLLTTDGVDAAINAKIGVVGGAQAYDTTILKSSAIGVTVQAYDTTILKSSAIGVTVQAYDADLAAFAAKTAPTGDVVGTTDTQTLTGKTLTTPTITGSKETKVAVSASNIDLSTGNYFTKTISATTTFTVSNVAASGLVSSFVMDLTNGGSATVNWWSGVKWASGTAPTLTSAGRDILGFFTHDGGTTWNGLVLAKDIK